MMKSAFAAVMLVVAVAACDRKTDLSASEIKKLNPSGQWVQSDGRPLGLIISHDPQGTWIVESLGKSPLGQAGNACWRVHAGSLNSAELVASSDANSNEREALSHANLEPYEGLFLDFKRDVVVVSGPEAEDKECPLAGDYVRKAGLLPTLSYRSPEMRGPRVGDPPVPSS